MASARTLAAVLLWTLAMVLLVGVSAMGVALATQPAAVLTLLRAPAVPAFTTGLLFTLAIFLPFGAQSAFLLQQGMLGAFPGGVRRMGAAWSGTALADGSLIIAGALGVSALLTTVVLLRVGLLAVGGVVLFGMGFASCHEAAGSFHALRHAHAQTDQARRGGVTRARPSGELRALLRLRPARIFVSGAGVTFLNAHAVLDDLAIIGTAIAVHAPPTRLAFAGGVLTGAWGYMAFLVLTGLLAGRWLGPPVRYALAALSGLILLLIASILLYQAALLIAALLPPLVLPGGHAPPNW